MKEVVSKLKVLVTGSNGMVGYCISQLVEELTISSSDTESTSLGIQAALDCLNESQDRESLIAFLKTVVP